MRKILRRIAHANMAQTELRGVNKKFPDKTSYFSRHWREWIWR